MTSRQRIDNSRDPLLRYGSQSTASSDTNGSGNVHKNTTFKDRINSIQFASISLENKGSVARDHVRISMPLQSPYKVLTI
ncbi:unnamed protein product [Debaryomyces tyrocola]|nr:unnamed protein product [Debaryomyces tyrocola]